MVVLAVGFAGYEYLRPSPQGPQDVAAGAVNATLGGGQLSAICKYDVPTNQRLSP